MASRKICVENYIEISIMYEFAALFRTAHHWFLLKMKPRGAFIRDLGPRSDFGPHE
jgi:hypothetical protein